jgi:hypothetical protein
MYLANMRAHLRPALDNPACLLKHHNLLIVMFGYDDLLSCHDCPISGLWLMTKANCAQHA